MLIFGLLLLLLAAAVIAYMVVATAGMSPTHLDYGILNVDLPPLWLFLAGAVTIAVAALGLWLMAAGASRKSRKSREVRELRKTAKAQDRLIQRSADGSAPPETTRGTATGTPTRPGTVPGPRASTTDRSRPDLDR
ncbi:MAG: hypothetical protein Q4P07_11070 [Ornithinimicrobium sp.]|uniref:hypothetical protein n=1 Tax=Ornithinimicrobium sp. TaxID=1977084 RepID=UPI0026DF996B|nr:hypothetical protein [Ornithinimicrobium sp.]MDO5740675.1 hypothetical protein [Ornithinimicrobium sp.]